MHPQGIRTLALASALLSASAQSSSPAAGSQSADTACQEALERFVTRTGVPGATLAVDFDSGRRIQCAAGFADREAERPMEPDARMLSGSTGKTFVAAVALALVAEDKLALDDPMEEWLHADWIQELPNAGLDITLRQLLDHTSGIPEYYLQPEFRPVLADEPTRVWQVEELLAFVCGKRPHFAPGEGWSYADSNYLLAGLVLEAAGEKPFYELCRERLLEPLALKDTLPSDRHELPGLTPGYTSRRNYFGLPEKLYANGKHFLDPSFEWCGGGFLSNAPDLARWTRLFATGKALPSEYLEDLLLTHEARIGVPHGYGLGLQVFETEHGPVRGHTGFFPGYLTAMGHFSEHGFALALQTNTDDTTLLGRYITFELETFAGVLLEALEPQTPPGERAPR